MSTVQLLFILPDNSIVSPEAPMSEEKKNRPTCRTNQKRKQSKKLLFKSPSFELLYIVTIYDSLKHYKTFSYFFLDLTYNI